MRLPIMRRQSASVLSLPDLSGGLNLRDGISEVLDNQLTDCRNMFWSEGLLRTRPAMYENEKITVNGGAQAEAPIRLHNCYKIYSGTKVRLCSVVTTEKIVYVEDELMPVGTEKAATVAGEEFIGYYINFFWLGSTSMQKFSAVKIEKEADIPDSFFVCQYSDTLYCFLNTGVIYKATSNESGSWEKVAESELYTPLVATSCRKIDATSATAKEVSESGVMIEGFNILNDYYKMSFNSYNPNIVTADNPSHEMRYHILKSIPSSKSSAFKNYADKTVSASYTKDGVTYEHEVVLNDEWLIKDSNNSWEEPGVLASDGLKMKVWRNSVSFWDEDDKIVMVSEGGEDDLIITAPYIVSAKEKQKVFAMTRTEWFGGGTSGLSGGTRLFLCGNKKHPDLVLWSGLNNPLYFPENSCFYVGNETGAVTGFGKQSDKLVIFKETETWCTEYSQNTNIDAESLISGSVVDFASSAVYFPLTQINPNIGCCYPDTVQLCRNRLVWLGSDKKVYTLVSESPYTERSIYCVSEMVDRKIKETAREYDISSACACDWNGFYCLLLKNTLLLMDYNCYGYTHVASYSKSEDANIKIPWFLWEPPNGSIIANVGDMLVAAEYENGIRSFHFADYSVDLLLRSNGEHYESPITSSFTTKVFNFGAPHIRKNIEQVNLQLGNNGGEPVTVFLVTDNGTEQTDVVTGGNDMNNYTAGYIDSCAVFPCIKQVLRLGLKAECKGTLAVDSVILKYRTTGGSR